MSFPREGGCLCGAGAYFRDNDVEIMRGELKTYEYRSDESGRWPRTQFCTGWVVPPSGVDVFQQGSTQPARQQ